MWYSEPIRLCICGIPSQSGCVYVASRANQVVYMWYSEPIRLCICGIPSQSGCVDVVSRAYQVAYMWYPERIRLRICGIPNQSGCLMFFLSISVTMIHSLSTRLSLMSLHLTPSATFLQWLEDCPTECMFLTVCPLCDPGHDNSVGE